jgi:hypothetical protein
MKIIKYSRCGGWILRIVSFAIDLTFFTGGVLLIEPVTWAGGTVASATEASLRAAMSGGGTVTFACDGTITLGNTITNALDTVLDGSGHQIIISGSGWRRVFFVSSNANFTVSNLTIATGASDNGAGIYNAGGHLAVRNCVFMYNTAIGHAGSNYSNPGSNGCGGAIFNLHSALVFGTFG